MQHLYDITLGTYMLAQMCSRWRKERKQKESFMVCFCTDFYFILLRALTNIQYELFMVLSTVLFSNMRRFVFEQEIGDHMTRTL